ncbi:MAG: fibronectin type III domain-containing protein [Treponema sp.]|jgi:hypothetical protein|nr:fibronectin type III domain-containing protein [Treponema sp.]
MKKETTIIAALYLFFLISGSPARVYGIGEKTLIIGADATWNTIESRNGITEIFSIRPYPVLVLSSALRSGNDPSLDMALSFDEARPEVFTDQTGHYQLSVSEGVSAADRRLARIGMGAALFSGAIVYNPGAEDPGILGPLRITPQEKNALFFPGRVLRDFSIEFWLFPMNMENGEHILSWTASERNNQGEFIIQRIQCTSSKNRLQWSFFDFFDFNAGARRIAVSLGGSTPLVPKTWSHHLIRFDSDTGLLEYLVNGRLEDITYATSLGREGGQVYYPFIGQEGSFVLGGRFMGMLDEFKLYGRFVSNPEIRKYPRQGGRVETRSIDLGESNSHILKVEVAGGRTSNSGGIIHNEYTGNGTFRFADNSMIQFFIRAAESPYRWTGVEWRPFIPGAELPDIRGRYVQIAALFYPSGDGETTPYLDEIRIIYRPDEPPRPPSLIAAIAGDGAVDLSWRSSSDRDVAGYLVYYGTSPEEYFGEGALLGASPINVGKRTSVHIDGLQNGTLYYFTVAAYDRIEPLHIGPFSREVTARPLRTIE